MTTVLSPSATEPPVERAIRTGLKINGNSLLVWGMSLFIIIPIVATFIAATSVTFSRGPWGGGITLDWFVLGWQQISPMLLRSFSVALLVVILNLIIVAPLAWWAPRLPRPLTRILTMAANLPLAIPGIALSIALIGTFAGLRPSGLLLVIGHLVLTLPFTLSALMPTFADPALREAEETANSLGASWSRVIATITIPWANVSILQAVTMVFAISFGEFNISFFINPPATPMAPFALFDAYSTQRLEIASAMSIIFILFAIPVIVAIMWARTRVSRKSRDK